MSKRITFLAALLLLLTAIIGCSEQKAQQTAPLLAVTLNADNMPTQRVQASQLTTSWSPKNGETAYEIDSLHPLDLSDYKEITLRLDNVVGEIEIEFSDNYSPLSVSIQRWSAEYIGRWEDVIDNGELVDVEQHRIFVNNDGNDYVYQIYATWEEGSSWYAFRLDSRN